MLHTNTPEVDAAKELKYDEAPFKYKENLYNEKKREFPTDCVFKLLCSALILNSGLICTLCLKLLLGQDQ